MSRPDEGPGCLLYLAVVVGILGVIATGLRLVLMLFGVTE